MGVCFVSKEKIPQNIEYQYSIFSWMFNEARFFERMNIGFNHWNPQETKNIVLVGYHERSPLEQSLGKACSTMFWETSNRAGAIFAAGFKSAGVGAQQKASAAAAFLLLDVDNGWSHVDLCWAGTSGKL